jgi:lipoprotein-releasing system permease protein
MSARSAWFIGRRYATASKGSMLVAFLSRISVVGLILGVALLVLVLSVMNGFERELKNRILNLVPHLSVLHYDRIEDWQAAANLAMNHESVEAAAPFIRANALLVKGVKTEGALIQAIQPQEAEKMTALAEYMTAGELDALENKDNGIVLSQTLADNLDIEVGERLRVIVPEPGLKQASPKPRLKAMQVVGLYNTGTEVDQGLVLVHLRDGQDLLGLGRAVQGVQLRISDVFDVSRVAWEVLQNLPPGFYSKDWQRTHGNLYHAIQMSRSMVVLMILMVVAVAVFNVVSSLVMVVSDKRGDVAILRTMGADDRTILMIFLILGFFIGVIGTVLGSVLGVALCYALPAIVSALESGLGMQFLNTSVYFIDYVPVDCRWQDVAMIAVVAIVMTVLATLYPALRAMRLQPADALRWD